MNVIAIEYVYDPARSDLIDEVRPRHREFIAGLHSEGTVLASGPFAGTDTPGALLLLAVESEAVALEALDADPFQEAGVITQRTARAWTPVTGPWAG